MVTVKCLYCDADNDPLATAGYCDACGKRLPPASTFRSRRGPITHASSEGADPEPEASPRTQAPEALVTAAAVQLVAGGLFLVVGPMLMGTAVPEAFLPTVILFTVPALALFACLAWVARARPELATVASLVVYVVLTGLGFVVHPPLALRWLPVTGVMLGLLTWAVWVGREHNPTRS
jgi:hypothetical protein